MAYQSPFGNAYDYKPPPKKLSSVVDGGGGGSTASKNKVHFTEGNSRWPMLRKRQHRPSMTSSLTSSLTMAGNHSKPPVGMTHAEIRQWRRAQQHIFQKSSLSVLYNLIEGRVIRRIIWGILIVLAVIFTMMQLHNQIQRFVKSPIATNVDYEYPEKMAFPEVWICNPQIFGTSHLAKNKLGELITEMAAGLLPGSVIDEEFYPGYKGLLETAGEVDAMEFLVASAFPKQRMILSCRWPNGAHCSANDFVPMLSEIGICFVINSNKSKFDVTESGSRHGLRLLLNAETYDQLYIGCSKHEDVGITVLVKDQNELRLVSQHGMQTPIGLSSEIVINKLNEREKVPASAGGSCSEFQQMTFFDPEKQNSLTSCVFDKMLRKMNESCNCILMVPGVNASLAPACTMSQYMRCADQIFVNRNWGQTSGVRCREACKTKEYDTSQLINQLPSRILLQDAARTQQRRSLTTTTTTPSSENQNETTPEEEELLPPPVDDGCQGLIDPEQIAEIKKVHLVGLEAKHRYIPHYVNRLKMLINKTRVMNHRLEDIEQLPSTNAFTPTFEQLSKNVTCIDDIYDNFELEIKSFEEPQIIPIMELLKMYKRAKPLLVRIDMRNEAEVEYFLADKEDNIRQFFRNDIEFVKETFQAFWQPFERGKKSDYFTLTSNISEYELFYKLIDLYEANNITKFEWATNFTDGKMNNFLNVMDEVFFSPVFNDFSKHLLHKLDALEKEASEAAAKRILSNDTLLTLAVLTFLPPAADSQEEDQRDRNLKRIDEPGSLTADAHRARFLEFTRLLLSCATGPLRRRADFLFQRYKETTANWKNAAEDLKDYLTEYETEFRYGDDFVRQNFVWLNIYFKNLEVEKLTQELTFTVWSLLCDIGGTLGLFLGASVLAVVELIWLCIEEGCVRPNEARPEETFV